MRWLGHSCDLIRDLNCCMLAMLEWASDHPTKWHRISKLEATQKAAELLEKRGVMSAHKAALV
jgi:hypothetical protein